MGNTHTTDHSFWLGADAYAQPRTKLLTAELTAFDGAVQRLTGFWDVLWREFMSAGNGVGFALWRPIRFIA